MKFNVKAFTAASALASLLLPLAAVRAQAAQLITIDTFVRAESDTAIRNIYNQAGGLGNFLHLRTPTPVDNQPIIRMNRDALYSSAAEALRTSSSGRTYLLNKPLMSYGESIFCVCRAQKGK